MSSRPVSGAWRYFKIKEHNERMAECTLCNMNNTSQPILTELLENKRPWPNTSLENKNNTDRLLKWLIDSMEPYNVVQNKLFKEFVQGEK